MKPMNFPGRKNFRRTEALTRLEAYLKAAKEAEKVDAAKVARLEKMVATTKAKLNPAASSVRTKKSRTSLGR